jgi:hypothetical protein
MKLMTKHLDNCDINQIKIYDVQLLIFPPGFQVVIERELNNRQKKVMNVILQTVRLILREIYDISVVECSR